MPLRNSDPSDAKDGIDRVGATRAAALIAAVGLAAVMAAQPAAQSWPAGVRQVPEQSPPLSAKEAIKTFHLPPGYRVELVAAEPLVQEPVALDWDLDGRLWVVEMPGWMPDISASGEHEPIGRVVVLEDTNRDGRMDRRTVFADKLILARSLKVLDRGVLVGEPPNVWLMRDTNGDLRMDTKELVTDQYGRLDTDPQNNANGFDWSLDNIMYTAGQADIHLRLKKGRFEVQRTLRRGEWGVTHDDAGRVYRNTNESALHVDLVPTYYFARHPSLLRTRGSYDRLADDNYELNTVWPVRPNPGTNRAYQTGIDRPDGSLARFTSVCAPVVYRGDRLPADVYGNVFVAEPAANLVSRLVVADDGTAIRARKAYERGEFLASTDERFRPVYLSNAPDGTLYIADLYRGIIEHRISITKYLRDHILGRRLERPTGLGRIYRVVHDTTKRDSSAGLSAATPAQLVEMLAHPNGWRRDTAQRLLVERGAASAAAPLATLARQAPDWRTRLHALWTLDGMDAVDPGLVQEALSDRAPEVRVAAVRIAERWLPDRNHPIRGAVMQRIDDPSWGVRQQLAASLGTLEAGELRDGAIATILERHATDPVVLDAALSGVRGSERAVLAKVVHASRDQTPERDAAIVMLSGTIVRGAQDVEAQEVFALAADESRPAWQRAAVLRGAEVALLGAAMPARPGGGRAGAPAPTTPLPCPTCPGGRAGPGGAYAFPRPEGWQTGGGRGTGPALRLARAPEALIAMAAGTDDFSKRATTLLARVSWPGKAGDAAVAPLSTEEQARFDAGREVYRNVCQSCHQPDGRGQDKIAPPLTGSVLLQAPPEIPVRILLHGKEGTIGLMPPIGGVLDDEQVASVLTYVRREWGQSGTPVTAATVRQTRAATTNRTRPWTDAELKALPAR